MNIKVLPGMMKAGEGLLTKLVGLCDGNGGGDDALGESRGVLYTSPDCVTVGFGGMEFDVASAGPYGFEGRAGEVAGCSAVVVNLDGVFGVLENSSNAEHIVGTFSEGDELTGGELGVSEGVCTLDGGVFGGVALANVEQSASELAACSVFCHSACCRRHLLVDGAGAAVKSYT